MPPTVIHRQDRSSVKCIADASTALARADVAIAAGATPAEDRRSTRTCDLPDDPVGDGRRRVPQLGGRTLPLFWRLFPMNAAVLVVASAVLALTPVTVSSPLLLSEAVILVAGLSAMLIINVVLTRRALVPLSRLSELMGEVDLLSPGQRIPIYEEASEVVQLGESFNAMLDRLEAERRETARRAMSAQEAERQRIAQELHDAIGQSLTVVLLQLDGLSRLLPGEHRGRLAPAQETVRAGIEDTRRIVAQLRPEALDDLGLRSALASLIQRVSEGTGVTIERYLDVALPPLSPDVELVVYRIAQEALTNAMRHSAASRVEVHLRRTTGGVRLRVRDHGIGLRRAAGPGGGLRGMRERAIMVGGSLRVQSCHGAGVDVCLDVDAKEPL
jgi:two-component system, NarL family, sensor histidine kinase UhpB